MTKGWMCPQCGKAHGPHVDTCPDGGSVFAPPVVVPTVLPWPTTGDRWEWAPPWETICGSVLTDDDHKIINENFWSLVVQ